MIYLLMIVKTIAWVTAFWLGISRGLKEMLLCAAGIALFLTVADRLTIAGHFTFAALLLTLLLYALMSFFLLPLAWKLKNPAVSMACNVMGTLGAFAVVNFAIDFLRSLLPLMSR